MASSPVPSLPAALDYPRIKIMALGSAGVGKSCLIKRYCEGRFIAKYIPTIGIDYGVKKVGVNAARLQQEAAVEGVNRALGGTAAPLSDVRVNFWDVAGAAEFYEIRNEFYAPAQGVLLVYDVTDLRSFEALKDWVKELNTHVSVPLNGAKRPSAAAFPLTTTTGNTPAGQAVGNSLSQPPVLFLCGNKVDLTGAGGRQRAVTEAQGRQWAQDNGCAGFMESSASTNTNVSEIMEALFYKVMARFMVQS